jgi:hypothetical protein
MHRQQKFLLSVALAAAFATPTLGQTVAPAVGPAGNGTHSTASIPDFSGIWVRPFGFDFEQPLSGPGPVVNTYLAAWVTATSWSAITPIRS